MNSELTPISEESLPFVHRHPVLTAALETVGAVAIVILLRALGLSFFAHSSAKELIEDAVAAAVAFPILASFHLERAAEAKKRLATPWSSRDGAA
jgi:hypothetical protein